MSFTKSNSRAFPRLRFGGWTVALLVALLAPASILAAPAAIDSFPADPDIFVTPFPCITDPVTVYVRGYVATPCDSFLYAYRSGEREIVIRTITRADRMCFAGPSVFYAVPIPFGLLPAGTHTIAIQRRQLSWTGDPAGIDSVTTTSEVTFSVSDACPDPPLPIPADQLPFVETARTVPSPACPDRPVTVELAGHFNDGCGRVVSATIEEGMPRLVLAPYPPDHRGCTENIPPWKANWNVGFVAPGFHSVTIEQTVLGTNAVWPPILDQRRLSLLDFTVASQCESLPGGPLPFVDFIHVGPAEPKPNDLICENTPYRVSIGGTFPDECYRVRSVDVIWNRALGNPALVRLVVDDMSCLGMVCRQVSTPWDTSVVLPGLPDGFFRQGVQLGVVSCSDSIPPDSLYSTQVPFYVVAAESCDVVPPVGRCMVQSWAPGSTFLCNAFIGQRSTAQLDFRVSTGVALSGLQGDLQIDPMGLQVKSIEAIGPAAGMHLNWTRIDQGARFVLFAEHGAPIPVSSEPMSLLRVTLEPAPIRVAWPTDAFYLRTVALLGADIDGLEVYSCPTMFREAPPTARICIERPCDFDGNGVADVRDLVRMVHCVHGEGPCPPDSTGQFDCNSDGTFGLPDVMCCAVHVLHGPSCPTCPIDSVRAEPEVRATFETPIVTEGGITIPLRLWGAYRVGAARLALRFPGDRYTLAGVEEHESAWLELHEGAEGEASVGLIRIGPDIEVDVPLSGTTAAVLVRLALKPGASPGGEIVLEGGELSGRDGVMLDVDLGRPRLALDGRAGVEVSSVRPNPSAGTFRISLSLAAPARLEVAVHDIAGRRVATVFEGDRPAGSHEFQWDGSVDGVQARGGVYFLRASARGEAVVKKLILLNRGSGPSPLPPARQSH